MTASLWRTIWQATLAAGILDILSAFLFNSMAGIGPGQVLRYVASGPFGDTMHARGTGAALVGLAVHFALMLVMVGVYAFAAIRNGWLRSHWAVAGVLYGVAIYLVMYWMVMPARFGSPPMTDLWSIGNALFSHIVCVGLPIAWIAARRFAR